MRYATIQDLTKRFGTDELCQRTDPDFVTINGSKVEDALNDAHADIDAALGMVYVLPLIGCTKPMPTAQNPHATEQVPPPLLTRWACDLARAYLWHNEHLQDSHPVAQAAKHARGQLKQVAEGKLSINCPWGGQPGIARSGAASTTSAGETYHDFAPRSMQQATEGYR